MTQGKEHSSQEVQELSIEEAKKRMHSAREISLQGDDIFITYKDGTRAIVRNAKGLIMVRVVHLRSFTM